MRNFFELGLCPTGEPCPKIEDENYFEKSREVGRDFIFQLEHRFPFCDKYEMRFSIKNCKHGFEVVVWFDDDDGGWSKQLAEFIERNLPEKSSDEKVLDEPNPDDEIVEWSIAETRKYYGGDYE